MAVEILENLKNAVIEGDSSKAVNLTGKAIHEGIEALEIIQDGLVPGIKTVGELFSSGDYYLPELLVSGKAMRTALEIVEPLLADRGNAFHMGKYLIGSVKGDIHDIGKNIVIMMLRGNGWEVTDLGVDVSPEKICSEIRDGDYDIFGMSTLLTVTMPAASETIEAIKKAGLRDKVKIMLGGAPVTQDFSDRIGADEYARDAWEAVTKAKEIVDKIR
jgi:5-methyltetrahydrofolate--homocysteine methyltransferase